VSAEGWSGDDARTWLEQGELFVPGRREQLETLLALAPVLPGPAVFADLGCGHGAVSELLLERVPGCRVLGIDSSAPLLEAAAERLAPHGERFTTLELDLAELRCRDLPAGLHAALSSLAIHHLEAAGKRRLFAEVTRALRPGGALLVADLVEPTSAAARELAAREHDEAVRRRSLERFGDLRAFERFRELGWNLWRDETPDPEDRPSPLMDQLRWLEEAGCAGVDCWWAAAGHAVFGGRRPAAPPEPSRGA
jgi:tRNA (cmo5U34)-methyltransferase